MTLQYKRISKAALASTVVIMFLSIRFALTHRDDLLQMPLPTAIFTGVGVGITSVGTYQLLMGLFFWIFSKLRFVRKWVLGSSYIEGTWVGHYVHHGLRMFTVEFIDQSHEETTVHGIEYADDSANRDPKRGNWTSHVLSIDGAKRRLIYGYTCSMLHRKGTHDGLAHFDIFSQKPGNYPDVLDGHAADLIDGDKDGNREYKIADAETTKEFALEEARKRFP